MARSGTEVRRPSRGFDVVLGALGVVSSACGGGLSSDERWGVDAEGPFEISDHEPAGTSSPTGACAAAAEQQAAASGYLYATPPGFWLGSQETKALAVDGAGYLVLSEPDGEPSGHRYSRDLSFFVAPDGSLQDAGGRRLLGYSPPGARCLAPLRAPWLAPPVATSSVGIQLNLDAREPVLDFALENADGSSNFSVSVSVTDSQGGAHWIDVYFHHQGDPGIAFGVHVTTDGSDLAGGVPGERVLLGAGRLLFSSEGMLYSDVIPSICASFRTGAPDQCFTVDFGHSMVEGNPLGFGGSTGFASVSTVYAVSADGWGAGLGADVQVDGWGGVSARFDNGSELALGTLALARFAREPDLITEPGGVQRASDESGEPQLGIPLSPGRGGVRFDASSTPLDE